MRVFLATTFASLILLAGCASTPFDAVEAPAWQSGYAFTYEVEGAVTGSASFNQPGEEPESETIDETFGPVKAFSYEIISTQGPNNTYLAGFLTHDALGGMIDAPAAAAIRKGDLTALMATVQGNAFKVTDSPAVDLAFPLTPGKSWSYTEASTPAGMEDGMGIGTLVYQAQATQATSVKIGNETLTVIETVHRISAPEFNEAMKEAQAELKAAGLDGSITGSFGGKRVILYSGDLEAVVRDTITIDVSVDMRVTYEGQTMTGKADTHQVFAFTLVGLDRLPEADRSVAQAAQFITSGQAIEAPGVVELPGEAFPLSINQSATEVNAADNPSVTFTAVGQFPEGATIKWGIFDAAGTRVATAEGESFAFPASVPGPYGIQASGYDANGRLAASSATLLIADYDGTIDLTCGVVSATVPMVSQTQTCTPSDFDVPEGLLSYALALDAGATGPAPGSFRVTDATGNHDVSTQNGMASIDSGLTTGKWSLQWRPTVGIAHSPSVHVTLDYGSAPKAPTAEDAMETTFGLLRALELPFQLPF